MLSYGRSGSTILADMLTRHPDVGFVSNVDDRVRWLPRPAQRYNSAVYRRLPQRYTEKGRRVRFAPSEGWRLLEREVSPIFARAHRTLSAADGTPWLNRRLLEFFGTRATIQDRPVFLHKLTGWPHADLLRTVFPTARFIHVVRDGRAVVDSDLRTSWWPGFAGPTGMVGGPLPPDDDAVWRRSGRSHAVLAAIVWRTAMREFARVRDSLPEESWIDVRFEDLLEDREQVFKRLAHFIGLAPSPGFDTWIDRTELRSGPADSFRRNLGADTLREVETVMADELSRWGYV
ncbi:MAG TPA: sulfotransferase [Nocardioidaceae bacterium]|nr:sulfotransferase [Nocardioidaceae bacterium]